MKNMIRFIMVIVILILLAWLIMPCYAEESFDEKVCSAYWYKKGWNDALTEVANRADRGVMPTKELPTRGCGGFTGTSWEETEDCVRRNAWDFEKMRFAHNEGKI